ncbi:MAG: WbqC family protein [Bacteroidaceae bacterium]|nr:WbqC family protein [Bacteroidaceae bacterium]
MLLPCCYLAPISHYSAYYRADEVRLEVCDHFTKQTLRNRCWIDSPNGALALTIPVVKSDGKTLMRDIRISDHGNWRHQHWIALESSYRQSPFFEYYADEFAPFYVKRWEFLADFNEELMALVASLLDISKPFTRTSAYEGDAFAQMPPFEARSYYQMFASRHGFLPDLSIVDLLFNQGPEGLLWL